MSLIRRVSRRMSASFHPVKEMESRKARESSGSESYKSRGSVSEPNRRSSTKRSKSIHGGASVKKMDYDVRLYLTPEAYPSLSNDQLFKGRDALLATILRLEKARAREDLLRILGIGFVLSVVRGSSKHDLDQSIEELEEYMSRMDDEISSRGLRYAGVDTPQHLSVSSNVLQALELED